MSLSMPFPAIAFSAQLTFSDSRSGTWGFLADVSAAAVESAMTDLATAPWDLPPFNHAAMVYHTKRRSNQCTESSE